MPEALSRGALQTTALDLESINDQLRRIRDELDELHGLRGSATFYGQKTLSAAAFRYVDSTGTLLHSFGATT